MVKKDGIGKINLQNNVKIVKIKYRGKQMKIGFPSQDLYSKIVINS